MTALPPSVAALLAEIETGQLSDRARSTLARALRAAASGQAVTAILNADSRARRDDALRLMCAEHFAGMAPSTAAKQISKTLREYASNGWPRDRAATTPPPAGLRAASFNVLRVSGPPGWRTVFAAICSDTPYRLQAVQRDKGAMDDNP